VVRDPSTGSQALTRIPLDLSLGRTYDEAMTIYTTDSVFGPGRVAEFEQAMEDLAFGECFDNVGLELREEFRSGKSEFVLESLDGRGGIEALFVDGKIVYRSVVYE
jgi:hypothetical protein